MNCPDSKAEQTMPERTLDARGLYCPEPVMLLHSAVREMAVGETVKVFATDPSTRRDIPKFCNFLGHALVEQQHEQHEYVYIIKKLTTGN